MATDSKGLPPAKPALPMVTFQGQCEEAMVASRCCRAARLLASQPSQVSLPVQLLCCPAPGSVQLGLRASPSGSRHRLVDENSMVSASDLRFLSVVCLVTNHWCRGLIR